ncbi:putative amidase [Cardamine amara subsp. amara]|uniref:Amidase n=1 Tax=Cardamine amara subsp. amara TaxID=228776 RepID=A0ABD0ZR55_CARAN
MGYPLCDHLARLCLQCDWTFNSETLNKHDHSRIPLCNNCVSQTAVVQCLEQGLGLCQTCVSNPNVLSRFFLLRNVYNYNKLGFNFPLDIDLDSSSSSSSSSLVDRNWPLSFGSLPLNNEDSSSSFDIFQISENYTKNYSDQQVPMPQPDFLDIPKDSSCAGFNGYETKENKDNVLLNTFDVEHAILDQNFHIPEVDLFLPDPIMDEITKQNANTTSTEIISSSSSVIHKDYNIEALTNASSQDYYKNQMIGSKAKEETNDLGRFPNALVQLDCELILTDEMLSWEEDKIFVAPRYNPQAREEAKQRYFAKKKKRKFGKQIRYESRKSTADTKRRMKGRFTKAGADVKLSYFFGYEATKTASKFIPKGGYKQFLKPNGLKGNRLGIVLKDSRLDHHIETLRREGAIVINNLAIPNMEVIFDWTKSGEEIALLAEFKISLTGPVLG